LFVVGIVATSFLTTLWHIARVNSPRSIVLIGMMGAGKSSVGRALQRRTGLARLDTDEAVCAQFGMSVAEIFQQYGEEKFRDAETEMLCGFAPDRPAIITTGGGIVIRPENVDLLKRLGTIVWLAASEELLFQRATRRNTRPLLQKENPRAVFSELFHRRLPLYEAAADFQIDTSTLDHEEAADAILQRLEKLAAL
jgi:shikimate kinase